MRQSAESLFLLDPRARQPLGLGSRLTRQSLELQLCSLRRFHDFRKTVPVLVLEVSEKLRRRGMKRFYILFQFL